MSVQGNHEGLSARVEAGTGLEAKMPRRQTAREARCQEKRSERVGIAVHERAGRRFVRRGCVRKGETDEACCRAARMRSCRRGARHGLAREQFVRAAARGSPKGRAGRAMRRATMKTRRGGASQVDDTSTGTLRNCRSPPRTVDGVCDCVCKGRRPGKAPGDRQPVESCRGADATIRSRHCSAARRANVYAAMDSRTCQRASRNEALKTTASRLDVEGSNPRKDGDLNRLGGT